MKTLVMVVALALFTGASMACFGLFSSREAAEPRSCEGLSGPAKTDCEQTKGAKPR